jgi:hypothetical protein
MYISTSDVYATAGIPNTVVPDATVSLLIQAAEAEVDRLTNTTYWSISLQATADAGSTSSTLKDTGAFTTINYAGQSVWIYAGTGAGQIRGIESNTINDLTVDRNWTVTPNNTSKYRIIYSGTSPYRDAEVRDGNNTDTLFTLYYPLVLLDSVSIDSTNITLSSIYQYKDTGKLRLSSNSEQSRWASKKAQLNSLSYWWGVYPIPGNVKRYVCVLAALKTLMAQAGGTYNIPSSYTMPEGSVTIGQASANIKAAFDLLTQEKAALEAVIVKYPSFADDPTIESNASGYTQLYWT